MSKTKSVTTINNFKLNIVFNYPPIPTTAFDYYCYIDGKEEDYKYGYGSTELEALANFLNEYHEEIGLVYFE